MEYCKKFCDQVDWDSIQSKPCNTGTAYKCKKLGETVIENKKCPYHIEKEADLPAGNIGHFLERRKVG